MMDSDPYLYESFTRSLSLAPSLPPSSLLSYPLSPLLSLPLPPSPSVHPSSSRQTPSPSCPRPPAYFLPLPSVFLLLLHSLLPSLTPSFPVSAPLKISPPLALACSPSSPCPTSLCSSEFYPSSCTPPRPPLFPQRIQARALTHKRTGGQAYPLYQSGILAEKVAVQIYTDAHTYTQNLGIPQPIYESTKELWPHIKSAACGITPEQVSNPEPPDSRPCV
jgi:hypothetical protein